MSDERLSREVLAAARPKAMMKCGHAANGTESETGKPVCVICIGIDTGYNVIDASASIPDGRLARCAYFHRCQMEVPSHTGLPFFERTADAEYDRFYCGCMGWD